jgi:DNA-binding GntR family transcriptional regulator
MPENDVLPRYARVVAEIKKRIERGAYPPGTLLPAEHQLVNEFAVSRPTIVRSLSVLRQDGWIETQQGNGSFVRGRPALEDVERTRPARDVVELAEAELAGELVQAGVKLAPRHVVGLLGLEAGSRAFVRQRLLTDNREPVELASLWLPLDVARGTDLSSPDLLNESIRVHLAARKKIRLDHAIEQITARHPVGEEAELLRIAPDAPVLSVVVTAYDAAGQPVQVSDVVLPGRAAAGRGPAPTAAR